MPGLLYWATTLILTTDGIENCALRQEIHSLPVLMHKRMETNIGVLMSSMHMRCGAQMILEEYTQLLKEIKKETLSSTTKNTLTGSILKSKQSELANGYKKTIDSHKINLFKFIVIKFNLLLFLN